MSAGNSGNWKATGSINDRINGYSNANNVVQGEQDGGGGRTNAGGGHNQQEEVPIMGGMLAPAASRMPSASRDSTGRIVSNNIVDSNFMNIMGGGIDGLLDFFGSSGGSAQHSYCGNPSSNVRHVNRGGGTFFEVGNGWHAGSPLVGWPSVGSSAALAAAAAASYGNAFGGGFPVARGSRGGQSIFNAVMSGDGVRANAGSVAGMNIGLGSQVAASQQQAGGMTRAGRMVGTQQQGQKGEGKERGKIDVSINHAIVGATACSNNLSPLKVASLSRRAEPGPPPQLPLTAGQTTVALSVDSGQTAVGGSGARDKVGSSIGSGGLAIPMIELEKSGQNASRPSGTENAAEKNGEEQDYTWPEPEQKDGSTVYTQLTINDRASEMNSVKKDLVDAITHGKSQEEIGRLKKKLEKFRRKIFTIVVGDVVEILSGNTSAPHVGTLISFDRASQTCKVQWFYIPREVDKSLVKLLSQREILYSTEMQDTGLATIKAKVNVVGELPARGLSQTAYLCQRAYISNPGKIVPLPHDLTFGKGEQSSNGRQLRRGSSQVSPSRMPSSPSIKMMKDKPDQREGQERRDGGCGDSGDGDEDGSSTDSDESPVVWLERSKRLGPLYDIEVSPWTGRGEACATPPPEVTRIAVAALASQQLWSTASPLLPPAMLDEYLERATALAPLLPGMIVHILPVGEDDDDQWARDAGRKDSDKARTATPRPRVSSSGHSAVRPNSDNKSSSDNDNIAHPRPAPVALTDMLWGLLVTNPEAPSPNPSGKGIRGRGTGAQPPSPPVRNARMTATKSVPDGVFPPDAATAAVPSTPTLSSAARDSAPAGEEGSLAAIGGAHTAAPRAEGGELASGVADLEAVTRGGEGAGGSSDRAAMATREDELVWVSGVDGPVGVARSRVISQDFQEEAMGALRDAQGDTAAALSALRSPEFRAAYAERVEAADDLWTKHQVSAAGKAWERKKRRGRRHLLVGEDTNLGESYSDQEKRFGVEGKKFRTVVDFGFRFPHHRRFENPMCATPRNDAPPRDPVLPAGSKRRRLERGAYNEKHQQQQSRTTMARASRRNKGAAASDNRTAAGGASSRNSDGNSSSTSTSSGDPGAGKQRMTKRPRQDGARMEQKRPTARAMRCIVVSSIAGSTTTSAGENSGEQEGGGAASGGGNTSDKFIASDSMDEEEEVDDFDDGLETETETDNTEESWAPSGASGNEEGDDDGGGGGHERSSTAGGVFPRKTFTGKGKGPARKGRKVGSGNGVASGRGGGETSIAVQRGHAAGDVGNSSGEPYAMPARAGLAQESNNKGVLSVGIGAGAGTPRMYMRQEETYFTTEAITTVPKTDKSKSSDVGVGDATTTATPIGETHLPSRALSNPPPLPPVAPPKSIAVTRNDVKQRSASNPYPQEASAATPATATGNVSVLIDLSAMDTDDDDDDDKVKEDRDSAGEETEIEDSDDCDQIGGDCGDDHGGGGGGGGGGGSGSGGGSSGRGRGNGGGGDDVGERPEEEKAPDLAGKWQPNEEKPSAGAMKSSSNGGGSAGLLPVTTTVLSPDRGSADGAKMAGFPPDVETNGARSCAGNGTGTEIGDSAETRVSNAVENKVASLLRSGAQIRARNSVVSSREPTRKNVNRVVRQDAVMEDMRGLFVRLQTVLSTTDFDSMVWVMGRVLSREVSREEAAMHVADCLKGLKGTANADLISQVNVYMPFKYMVPL